MSKYNAQKLAESLQDWTGEYLRSVIYFDGDSREILYMREDIVNQYTDNEISTIFNNLSFDSLGKSYQENMYTHGDLNCIIRCFDQAIEIHFPHGEVAGTAIALEPGAIMELEGVINIGLQEFYEEYPSS